MKQEHTIEELSEWIVRNRKGNAFTDCDKSDIALGLYEDIKNQNVLYAWDDKVNDFIGIVVYSKDVTNKVLFIRQILITKHTALVQFINAFHRMFQDFVICANRDNEYVMYNTYRLTNLLTKVKGVE